VEVKVKAVMRRFGAGCVVRLMKLRVIYVWNC